MNQAHTTKHSTMPRVVWCLLSALLFTAFVGFPGPAMANTLKKIQRENKRCFKLYRSKKFMAAITCYKALRKLNKNAQYLVNIAQSYRLSALQQSTKPRKDLLSEKSIAVFHLYKKEAPHANFWTNKMIDKLNKSIGYSSLSIKATPATTTYTITGYEYKQAGNLPFQNKLRPGDYTILLAATGYVAKVHKVTLKPNQVKDLSMVLTSSAPAMAPAKILTPKVSARGTVTEPDPTPGSDKPRLLPWIAVGAAAALVVTGVVFVGLSAGNSGQIDDPNTSARQAQDALYQRGWQTPTGWTFIGLGAAVGIGAVVLFLLPKKKAEPPPGKAAGKSFVIHLD